MKFFVGVFLRSSKKESNKKFFFIEFASMANRAYRFVEKIK